MATFTLTIELGNDAMQTYADIARSVQLIFSDMSRRHAVAKDDAGRIYDGNGNKVGTWEVSE